MSTDPHHTSTLDKIFHRQGHRNEQHEDEHGLHPGDYGQASSGTHSKKESEIKRFEDGLKKEENKFQDYLDKDEELEEEGKTYGGLM